MASNGSIAVPQPVTSASTPATAASTPEQIAQCQAAKLRVVRRALEPNIGTGYVAGVTGHHVTSGLDALIRPNQSLQPMQLSRYYVLYPGQTNDTQSQLKLARYSAADLAFAEDLVCLHGHDALPHLERLQIVFDKFDLERQTGLLEKGHGIVEEGKILPSIVEGITTLLARGYPGEYYAIVSPALFEDAHKNRGTLMDAPIYQISPC